MGKWLSFGLYSTRRGAKTAARNYGLKSPVVRQSGVWWKLFERDW